MSLLTDAMEACRIMDRHTSDDGYGGYNQIYVEGAEIDAAIVLDSSMQARVAEKQGVTALYTITTKRNVNLQYHDIIKRVRDEKVFRVTSDGDDKYTPRASTLDMRQVSAEEWVIPNG